MTLTTIQYPATFPLSIATVERSRWMGKSRGCVSAKSVIWWRNLYPPRSFPLLRPFCSPDSYPAPTLAWSSTLFPLHPRPTVDAALAEYVAAKNVTACSYYELYYLFCAPTFLLSAFALCSPLSTCSWTGYLYAPDSLRASSLDISMTARTAVAGGVAG